MLEQRQFAVYGCTEYLFVPPQFVAFDVGWRNVRKLPLDTKELLQRLEQLFVS